MTATKWRRERLPKRAAPPRGVVSRRRPAWYLIVLAAIGVTATVLGILQIGSPASSARTAREVVTAERGIVQSTVSGSGDVEPAVNDSVSFQTSGTLQHLYVKQGDHVFAGQLLATLDPTSAQDTVDQAEQELTSAQDSLSAAETASSSDSSTAVDRSDSFISYSPTTTSTTAAGTSSTPSTTAPTRSTTSATTTTVTVTAPTTTPSSGSASDRSGSGSGSGVSAASGTGDATASGSGSGTGNGSGGGSGTGSGSGSGSSSQTTTSNPDTLAANIASAQAQVDSAQATLKTAETALAQTKLYAPAAGTVVSVEDVSPGDAVSGSSASSSAASSDSSSGASSSSTGGTTSGSLGSASSDSSTSSTSGLVEIVNTHRMTVTVPFDESDISKLKVGQPATVTFDALTGVELGAKVSSISTLGTTSDDVVSYDATLTLTQRNAQVKPGMTASAAVIYRQASGVTLPNSAVPGTSNLATVNVTAGGKTTATQVIVGVRGDSRTQIVKGLSAGQQVVVTETLPSTKTASSSSSSSGTLGATSSGFGGAVGGGFGGGGFGGGGFGGAGRFGGG